jgi:hypothetical protein
MGTDLFENRIPDSDDIKTRKTNGKPFSEGD